MKNLLILTILLLTLNAQDFRKTKPLAWTATTMDSALKALYGTSHTIKDARVVIKAPSVAANGGAVPVYITTNILAKSVSIFQDVNHYSLVSVFNVLEDSIATYSIKIRLSTTGNIKVVVEGLDGKLYSSTIHVEVAKAGCEGGGGGSSYSPSTNVPAPTPVSHRAMSNYSPKKSIGFSVGGAKDSDNFYENIKNNYIPKISSLTYEGTFYDHYFDIGIKKRCETLFCPTYSKAMVKDIYNEENSYYLSVGLNSGIKDFKRKKLNLVVVLDISASMNGRFNEYSSNSSRKKTKMRLANEAIVSMIKHLKDEDRLGIVLFNNRSHLAKPLRYIKDTDIKSTKKHILNIRATGGTNWKIGYDRGVELFGDLPFEEDYENRVIFITDAMPNRGELSANGLFSMVKRASKKSIYTSFIGVGVDFNSDLVEIVTKTSGANYYSVHSSKDFEKRLDKEFDFMVTPLVFDLKLSIESRGYEIEAIYGSPEAKQSTKEIMKISTLFPSAKQDGKVKGGIVLVKLKKTNYREDDGNINLSVSYKDRDGKRHNQVASISFDERDTFYENSGIQKGILLSNYVDLMKNWMLDSRMGCNNSNARYTYRQDGLTNPYMREEYRHISKWEEKSCPLKISNGYKKIFSIFKREFKKQMEELEDKSLAKELDLINSLIKEESKKKDDWLIR
ncbi:MAG: thiosulfate oxidation carrier protein SoxY [Sulfurovum sp.]